MSKLKPCPRAKAIMEKCEQYWNEVNIPDAEVHAVLERIHEHARALAGKGAPLTPDPATVRRAAMAVRAHILDKGGLVSNVPTSIVEQIIARALADGVTAR